MLNPSNQLFLIDGHALCYKSFYAIRELKNSKGQATNAVYGFINTLRMILKRFEPKYMAVCFDSKEKTNRQQKFNEYKIQRPKMPDDLISQIPIIKEVLKAYRLAIFEIPGLEADDLIATISKRASKGGVGVVVVSDDKDLYQLADANVEFFSTRKEEIFTKKEIKETYGFDPGFIIDFIGLAGDSSDNIPGVKGIGKVTATKLINDYGTLEEIYQHIDDIFPLKVKEKLVDNRSAAFLSKELAILETEAPIEFNIKDLEIRDPDRASLYNIFQEMEFRKLAKEYQVNDDAEEELQEELLKDAGYAEALIREIKEVKKCSILLETVCDDLFEAGGKFAVCVGKDKVFLGELNAIGDFKGILEDEKILKITYDVKALIKALYRQGINISRNVFDVMLAGYLISPSQASADISHLAWEYVNVALDNEAPIQKKVRVNFRLYEKLLDELKEKSLLNLLEEIEQPLSFVLAEIELVGVAIDVKFLEKLSSVCQKKIDDFQLALFKLAGEEFNLNSPKQLSVILFEKLKLPVVKKTKTGFSTDEEVLTVLAEKHKLPALLLEYRQIAKLKSTYIDALPKLVDPKTRHVHTEFNQIGAETGRLSSKNPNLQNIPIRTEFGREIRRAVIASDKDHMLIAADYSQIELRILAHLSMDENLIAAFKSNQDIHTSTSAQIFGIDEKDVTKDMRYAAKRVNFGIVYGMSAFGLAKDLKVTQKEAQEFIDLYFLRYPKVKEYMDAQVKACEKDGFVSTLLKRRRYIPEINSSNQSLRNFAQRQAINTPVQGSAADLIKLAMINVDKELKKEKLRSRMVMTVHDELVFDVPKKEEAKIAGLLKEVMEHPVKLAVPLSVSVKAGKNWLEMETV